MASIQPPRQSGLHEFYILGIWGVLARHMKVIDVPQYKKAPSVQVGEQDKDGNVVTIYATEEDAAYLRTLGHILFPVRGPRHSPGS